MKCATKDPFLQEKTIPPKFAFEEVSKHCQENIRENYITIIYIYIYVIIYVTLEFIDITIQLHIYIYVYV